MEYISFEAINKEKAFCIKLEKKNDKNANLMG